MMTVKRKNLQMYFSASALAGFEIIILLTLQVMIGNMYQLTGLIVAGLMIGLAAGSGLEIKFLNSLSIRWNVVFLMLFYICFALIYNYMIDIKGIFASVLAIILAGFLPSFLTGHLFRELTINRHADVSSAVYSADLAGSALGFIIISGFAVPAFGIRTSVFLLAALILSGILFGKNRKME
jgi:hypothetical protein